MTDFILPAIALLGSLAGLVILIRGSWKRPGSGCGF